MDTTYTSDALAWLMVWSAAGLTARQVILRAQYRRSQRRRPRPHGPGSATR